MSDVLMSPLGPVPDGWKLARFRDVTSKIGSGATPRGGKAGYRPTRSNYALIRSQNVLDRRFSAEGLAFISDTDAESLRSVEVREGDILLNITGDGVTFGRACAVPRDILPAVVNQHVSIIRVRLDLAVPGFVLSYLTHPVVKAYVESFNAGGSRRAITKGHIESFALPLPPLHEQLAIAASLGVLDDKIELNRGTNEMLEAMARAIFKSWFVDFDPVRAKADGSRPAGMAPVTAALFPDSFDDSALGRIPMGWLASTLGQAIEIYDSRRIPLSSRERAQKRGLYPYYGAASAMDYVDDYLFDGIYVLVGEDGSVVNDDGTPVVQYVWGKFWVNNHAHVLQGRNGVGLEHLLLFLRQADVRPFVTGAVQPKLNQGNLCAIPFILPPGGISTAFTESVSSLYARLRASYDESLTLAAIRDALLPKLLSGEVRVRDAEKLVGAAT